MRFHHQDNNWRSVLAFVVENKFFSLSAIAPIEFCNEIAECDSYEWSYWNNIGKYKLVILHKGMYSRLNECFLKGLKNGYDYVYGNAVFNVYLATEHNRNDLKGVHVHLSFNRLLQSIKCLIHSSKKYKATQKNKNILLVTANNCGNIGDDAITMASKDILETVYPEATVIVDKGPASKELIRKVDLVVLGGGGIFYDSNFYNAQNYCQYLLFAAEAGVKSIGIGIGAQGIKSDAGRELFKRSVNLMEYILVRDDYSKEILCEQVNTDTDVILSRDVVFSLNSNAEKFLVKRQTNKPLLLFSLLDSSKMIRAKATAKYHANQEVCMKQLTDKFEVKLFVQSRDDLDLFEALQKQYGLEIIELGFNHTRKALDIYKQADLVITSRLHGFIFAARAGTPVMAVSSKNGRSKLGSLVYKYIPSAQKGNLVLKDYSPETLSQKLELYDKNPESFKLDDLEVKDCIEVSQNIVHILKQKRIDI